jgi:hypothetical protein
MTYKNIDHQTDLGCDASNGRYSSNRKDNDARLVCRLIYQDLSKQGFRLVNKCLHDGSSPHYLMY